MRRDRSQCIVLKDDKLLMANHRMNGESWWCLPGGAIEAGETPEEAALRELFEECMVKGSIVMKTSEYKDPITNGYNHTFLIDIGNQVPKLGEDPELIENPILYDIKWLGLNEICARDRAYIWSAGLISIKKYADELATWNDEICLPGKAR